MEFHVVDSSYVFPLAAEQKLPTTPSRLGLGLFPVSVADGASAVCAELLDPSAYVLRERDIYLPPYPRSAATLLLFSVLSVCVTVSQQLAP